MNIIDHGMWSPYEPDPADIPDAWPANVLFLQRDGTNKDWYKYTREGNFNPDNVKFQALYQETFGTYVIGPAVFDATRLFPRLQYVGEVTDYTGSDPMKDFSGKLYDPITGTITDKPPPPEPVNLKAILDKLEARVAALESK
jgi:hypothetical protein